MKKKTKICSILFLILCVEDSDVNGEASAAGVPLSSDERRKHMTSFHLKVTIQRDIHTVWETIRDFKNYSLWRRDVEKAEVLDEKRFVLTSKDGYATDCFITSLNSGNYMEIEMENSSIKGSWTAVFKSIDHETELDLAMQAEAKQLFTRPVGKNVFEQTYLRKELEEFAADLKRELTK